MFDTDNLCILIVFPASSKFDDIKGSIGTQFHFCRPLQFDIRRERFQTVSNTTFRNVGRVSAEGCALRLAAPMQSMPELKIKRVYKWAIKVCSKVVMNDCGGFF
jgi:hypothetical protein